MKKLFLTSMFISAIAAFGATSAMAQPCTAVSGTLSENGNIVESTIAGTLAGDLTGSTSVVHDLARYRRTGKINFAGHNYGKRTWQITGTGPLAGQALILTFQAISTNPRPGFQFLGDWHETAKVESGARSGNLTLNGTIKTINAPGPPQFVFELRYNGQICPPIFKYVRMAKVTPVDTYRNGDFVKIGYVPGRDRILVAFSGHDLEQLGNCSHNGAYVYKEYTTDMDETGSSGVVHCLPDMSGDTGGLIAGNDLYTVVGVVKPNTDTGGQTEGWQISKYNAVTLENSASVFYPLDTEATTTRTPDEPIQMGADPTVAIVNGLLDISSLYRHDPYAPMGLEESFASHHNFFTTDLELVHGPRILSDAPHFAMASMIQVGGVINYVSGTAIVGNVILMQYDLDWNYLGGKLLKENASSSQGVAFDGKRFYVTYLDVLSCNPFPCEDNVRLAAFDINWNLLQDIAVTNYTHADAIIPNRPTLTLHNGLLYVAWDQGENPFAADPRDADLQVYVKMYDVSDK